MSYTVFLVEDEIVARESMRDNIPWDESGFALVGEAADGEAALPLICESRPDIVVSDIRMPFMDGLELAKALRTLSPATKVLFLSGHDEFAYLKAAIALSAADYLLKPVTPGDMVEALRKTALLIEEEREARAKLEALQRSSEEGRRAMSERFLYDLAYGAVGASDALAIAMELGLDLVAKYYCAAVVVIEGAQGGGQAAYSEYLRAEWIAREFLEAKAGALVFRRGPKELAAIFKGEAAEGFEAGCVAALESLRAEVERQSGCTVSAGVGGVKDRLHGIARSGSEAETAASYRYLFGEGRVVLYEEALRLSGGRALGGALAPGSIARTLREGTAGEAAAAAAALADALEAPGSRGLYRDYAIADLLLSAAQLVQELGGDAELLLPSLGDAEAASRSPSPESVRALILDVVERTLAFREGRREDKYGDLVRRAKRLVEEHFSDPDLSLGSIAEQVCMSPSHFSAVFSQETGSTFTETLSRARIDRAKTLLRTTSQRSSEIAAAVGFRDPHYFSYAFKRREGMTPQEFRAAAGDRSAP
jgi:two-component system response regulator YesN